MLALRIFDRMHASPEDPRVRAAVKYLVSTFDDMLGYWHAMPDIEMLIDLVVHLPAQDRGDAVSKLRQVLQRSIERDPQKWSSYGIQPTTFVEGPDSPFYLELEQLIAANLDYIVSMQRPDGGWNPNWSWSDVDASAWQVALKEIRASVTLQNLTKLRAYHRIAGN
jgi:hypothetical protein